MLFNGCSPLSFHTHVSDITPSTMASLLLHLSNTSVPTDPTCAAHREIALQMLDWNESHVRSPRFAVMSGAYGAAYGPQVGSIS